MASERVKCTECENMILPATAEANDGLCAQCANLSPESREENRQFSAELADGRLFRPTEKDLAAAREPETFGSSTWRLHPEYYTENPEMTLREAVSLAADGKHNTVVLSNEAEDNLVVKTNSEFGVCEFSSGNPETNEWRYAYTEENLSVQVPERLHLVQPCPCCGVGLGWYPSRTHMPRAVAIEILTALATGSELSPGRQVKWVQFDNYYQYDQGKG